MLIRVTDATVQLMLPNAEQMLEHSMPPSDVKQNKWKKRRNRARDEEGWLRGLNIRAESLDFWASCWGPAEFTRSFLHQMKPENPKVWFLEEPGTHSFSELCLDLQTPSISAWQIPLDSQIAGYPKDQGFHPSLPFIQAACVEHEPSAGLWGLGSTLQSFCYPKQCITIIGTRGQICKPKMLLHIP